MGQKCYSSYPEVDVRSKLICVKSKLLSTGLAANLACLNRISNFLKEFDLCLSFYPWPPETPPPLLKICSTECRWVGTTLLLSAHLHLRRSTYLPTYVVGIERCQSLRLSAKNVKWMNWWARRRTGSLIGKFSPSITNQIPQLVNKLVKLLDVKNIF